MAVTRPRSSVLRIVAVVAAAALLGVACGSTTAPAASPEPTAIAAPPTTPPVTVAPTQTPSAIVQVPGTGTIASTPSPTPTALPTSTPTPVAVPAGLAERLEAIIAPWAGRPAAELELSVSIVLPNGAVFEHEADATLFPASNQKLLTALGAYELLDGDHRFETSLLADGPIVDGTLDGDLVLVAGGDPTLTTEDLRALAAEMGALGVSVVGGDLVIDATRFDDATIAPGWQDWQMPAHVGPLSAFVIDENRGRTDTAFVANPALANGERFAELLGAAGIAIQGDVVLGEAPPSGALLGVHRSEPLDVLITTMLYDSNNVVAEAIAREIGVVVAADGSTPAGVAAIENAARSLGLDLDGTSADASGMSRGNLHSAGDWRRLLQLAPQQPWFDRFLAAMPRSGESGTMRDRYASPEAVGRVVAKTGTIIGGRSLSGYVLPADDRTAEGNGIDDAIVFSIVVNGSASDAAIVLIDELVLALLAHNPGTT